jgi:hypothetical protein
MIWTAEANKPECGDHERATLHMIETYCTAHGMALPTITIVENGGPIALTGMANDRHFSFGIASEGCSPRLG